MKQFAAAHFVERTSANGRIFWHRAAAILILTSAELVIWVRIATQRRGVTLSLQDEGVLQESARTPLEPFNPHRRLVEQWNGMLTSNPRNMGSRV